MSHPTTSTRFYCLIFAALLLLTGLTWLTAESRIGGWHTPVALAIAVAKAALVVLFFMHALHSGKLTWVVILASAFMLFVLISLTLGDYLTRPWSRYW
jgi:cytochrome c oxidase subunit 4